MVEYMAVSGPNCSKSKDLSASDNTKGNQIASFRDLLVGKSKLKLKQKSKDLAASDNTNKVDQVAMYRNLLVKGIF
jgi:hypothetical protein